MSNVCYTWGNAGVQWMNVNWLWSECSGSVPPIPPVTASVVVQRPGIDATVLIQPWLIEPWNPYRAGEVEDNQKKWIRLICKVKGETFEEKKEIGKHTVSVDDVKMVIETMTGINVDVKKLEE